MFEAMLARARDAGWWPQSSALARIGGFVLVVKVELWPEGDGRRIKELGRIVIANVGGDDEQGDYRVALAFRGRTDVQKILQSPHRSGFVTQHGRLKNNVWTLVAKALRSVGFRYDVDVYEGSIEDEGKVE